MTESTALTIITPEEQAYLDSLDTGAPNENNGPIKLEINTKAKDNDGNKQVIGAWHLYGNGTNLYYDGAINFRPVRYFNTLIRYIQNATGGWDFVGRTVYFTDYRDEILDSLGGIFGKARYELSEEEQDANKKLAGAYADVFGFATINNEQYPVVIRVQGGKLKTVLDAFNSIPKDKKYSQYNYSLETYQEEDEGSTPKNRKYVDYWSIKIVPDM